MILGLDQGRSRGGHLVEESLGRGVCSGHSSMRGNLHGRGRGSVGARRRVI